MKNRVRYKINIVSAIVVALVITFFVSQNARAETKVKLTTKYQAVLLTNGQAYFGKLENLGSDYPVLTDVFYVQSRVNPETKQATNALVKRGVEWHSPDRMIINAKHIIFIETVDPGSRVAKLIEEFNKKEE